MGGVSALAIEPVYAEGDPIIWLPVADYRTARAAKHAAWNDRGLPWTFSEEHALLKDLEVRRVWMKSMGPHNGYDLWWQECNVTDVADCTEFFRVEWKPSWMGAA